MILSNYETIEKIYESNNSVIYRSKRKKDGLPVIIKILNDKYPSREKVAKFKYEYEILKDLNFEGVIKVYSLDQLDNSPAIVEEDFGGEALKNYNLENLDLKTFLSIFIKITEVLGKIQDANIIHKDINPSNIIWNKKTGQLKIIDFGISTKLSGEKTEILSPDLLEGTLKYISPEQTGRMNRPIDYRTDFYSLGVTFYELLTKRIPFTDTKDLMELVHCHIAKQPLSPSEINGNIPSVLSKIILKLMAKNAEDRYQSILGLKIDLENCLNQLIETNKIDDFEICKNDRMSQFQIPGKLYGREKEIEVLMNTFGRVCKGHSEFILVSGFSGIGKSALINEIQKPIVQEKGYFISGKYDQFQRNIPYSAIIQSFRDLLKQILTESPDKIKKWKEDFLKNLGSNGQVIVNVLPELEFIIGKQKSVQELTPAESQNRFHFTFQCFLNTFIERQIPLVVFIDDLQWTDNPSLQLIQLLVTSRENKYLFFIGAYRDNEIDKSHPLILAIDSIEKKGFSINRIVLKNLQNSHVNQLVFDTLSSSPEKTKSLSELVYLKTEGNPFFVTELLKYLSKNKLIQFNRDRLEWTWNINQIKELTISDNVVELMSGKIKKLSENAKDVLKLAACIGNYFDLKNLSIIAEKSKTEIASFLWELLLEGLTLPLDDSYKFIHDMGDLNPHYKFVHDRIQQAAYSLISDSEKEAVHLKIGRLFLKHFSKEEREEKIFDIVNHLNLAKKLITDENELDDLAVYNLQAGISAKLSAAFLPAKEYFNQGILLLRKDSWEKQYALSISLYTEAAEMACVNGEFAKLEQFTEIVLENAKSNIEKAKSYDIQIMAYMAQNNPAAALKTTFHALRLLGVNIPEQPTEADIGQGIVQSQALWVNHGIDALLELPEMTDPEKLIALQIMSTIAPIIYTVSPIHVPLYAFTMLDLSIKYGNAHASTFGYASYGLVLCGALGDVENGYQFGQLAVRLLERLNAKEFKARTYFYINVLITHWKRHLNETLDHFMEGYHCGMETGDVVNAALCAMQYGCNSYVSGRELTVLSDEMEKFGSMMQKLNQNFALLFNDLYKSAVQSWFKKGKDGEPFFEEYYQKMLPILNETHNISTLWIVYLNRLIYHYSFREYSRALENAGRAEQNIAAASGSITQSQFYLFDSLLRLALYNSASDSEKEQFLNKVTSNQEKMFKWAEKAPMNFMHKFYLVEGEKARVLGQKEKAVEYFDKAIVLAKESGFIQEEALANEITGQFWLENNKEEFAGIYFRKAYYDYQIWGAANKTDSLKKMYPDILKDVREGKRNTEGTISATSTSEVLDLATIIKSTQVIAKEIVLESLLIKLLNISLENAGASKGYFLTIKKGQLWIEAGGAIDIEKESRTSSVKILGLNLESSIEAKSLLPISLINYIARTKETVVLNNAAQEGLFTKDPYIVEKKPKSILCIPIVQQGKLSGILYLENDLATGVFTEHRIEILQILTAQAAISIENSLLYANLEEKVFERTNQLEEAHKKILLLEKENTEKQMAGGFAHEMRNALVGPKLVIQQMLGYDKTAPFTSVNLENSRKLKEIYLELQKILSADDLQGILKIMRTIFQNEEQMEESLNMVYRAVSKGLTITQQIMDYSKVGHEDAGKKVILINKVLQNLANENASQFMEAGIRLNLQIEGDDTALYGLDSHFDSVFKNLLLNAKDAVLDKSIQDGRNKVITITSRIENKKYIVKIADNGVGISPENIYKIYNAFFSTKPDTGTGLGLGMVQKIVAMYSGTIDVQSEVNIGTTFTVQFPIFAGN